MVLMQCCKAPQNNVNDRYRITNILCDCLAEICGPLTTSERGEAAQVAVRLCDRRSDIFRHVKTGRRPHVGELQECRNRVPCDFLTKSLETSRVDSLGRVGNSFDLSLIPKAE